MIKYYDILDANGGIGGDDKLPPPQPKGYVPLTVSDRAAWNGFLDYASKQNGVNISDPKQQAALLASYKKVNPNFSITPDKIPSIQYEAYQLRKGDSFGSLNAKQLEYLRGGFNPNFLNADVSNIGKTYYPQMGVYGTDIENYYNSKFNPSAAKPVAPPATAPSSTPTPAAAPALPGTVVPRPTADDPKTIQKYRNTLYKKYGQGSEDVVDMPEYVNVKPAAGTDTMGNIVKKVGAKVGLRPSLLLASALIEGAKGLEPGTDPKQSENYSGDENFPVSGYVNFGLDTFSDKFPDLVKKGYLSPDFANQFKKHVEEAAPGDNKTAVNSANFKSADAAFEAKAAMIKDLKDQTDDYAKSNGIKLSDKGRDFFTLVGYNGGNGLMKQMMTSYNKGGFLKDDKYITQRPTDSYKSVHREISKRIKGAEILDGEHYLD